MRSLIRILAVRICPKTSSRKYNRRRSEITTITKPTNTNDHKCKSKQMRIGSSMNTCHRPKESKANQLPPPHHGDHNFRQDPLNRIKPETSPAANNHKEQNRAELNYSQVDKNTTYEVLNTGQYKTHASNKRVRAQFSGTRYSVNRYHQEPVRTY